MALGVVPTYCFISFHSEINPVQIRIKSPVLAELLRRCLDKIRSSQQLREVQCPNFITSTADRHRYFRPFDYDMVFPKCDSIRDCRRQMELPTYEQANNEESTLADGNVEPRIGTRPNQQASGSSLQPQQEGSDDEAHPCFVLAYLLFLIWIVYQSTRW